MPGVDALGWFKGEQFKSAKCFQYSPKLIGLFADHMELRAVCHTDKRYSTGEALLTTKMRLLMTMARMRHKGMRYGPIRTG